MVNQSTHKVQEESQASCQNKMLMSGILMLLKLLIIIDCVGMHTSYCWQVCTLSTFGRYAASGGHNAILQLLLLQPGIDINTPDR